jgi:hypothetical protein
VQKTRPDALAFLSDFVIDAVVDQFAREIVLECTRERSREALYLLKEEREISRFWDDLVSAELTATATASFEELKAEQAALAKKAQPQVPRALRRPPAGHVVAFVCCIGALPFVMPLAPHAVLPCIIRSLLALS